MAVWLNSSKINNRNSLAPFADTHSIFNTSGAARSRLSWSMLMAARGAAVDEGSGQGGAGWARGAGRLREGLLERRGQRGTDGGGTRRVLRCLPGDCSSQRSEIYETAINSLGGYYCMILCRLEFNTKFKIIRVIMGLLNYQREVSAGKVLPRQT